MKKLIPHNPPNICDKCGGYRVRWRHGVKACECKPKQTSVKNIKDKFEAVITKMIRNGNAGGQIAEECNTLHNLALKEERKKNKELLGACIEAEKHHQGKHSKIGFVLREAIKKSE